jgi:hypothetical protein
MGLYSVWDWDRNAWAIYANGDSVSIGDDPKPPKPSNVNAIGADPDTQMKPLPSNAKLVGYEHMARGEIRRHASMPLGLDEPGGGDMTKYVVGAVVGGAVVWWWLRRR